MVMTYLLVAFTLVQFHWIIEELNWDQLNAPFSSSFCTLLIHRISLFLKYAK